MNKTIFITLALTVLSGQAAFAQNLGALPEEQIPQSLVQASEIEKLASSNSLPTQPQTGRENTGRWWGWGGLGYYWPYASYYYPTYGYGYYGYYPWYFLGESSGNRTTPTLSLAQTPMICFASDSSGNGFASTDVAIKATQVQRNANAECAAESGECVQNLGCVRAVE